ncbi:hypothetical protein KSP35_12545 [Aquihabitans sp. G128]|uniref:hypothetical protein n=1 Tax=Aquihabitans sp. G128 TaxID=2849779 RepID=UPI001C21A17C|nr:hypothetical protein [Aquihabitans sp. G128]QXC59237.1 hypothetical protein KSP35_12545 [Aquihabitans sp. G128]
MLARPSATTATIRHAVAGSPDSPTLDLAGLRSLADTFYGDDVIEEAPAGAESDTAVALRAFRAAVEEGSVAPLDRSPVRAALRRLEARAPEACPDAPAR